MRWCLSDFAKVDNLLARLLSFLPERATDAKGNAIPFAEQARGLGGESDREFDRREQETESNPQGRVAALRIRDVCARDGRAVRGRRHGYDARSVDDAAVSLVRPVVLVHSGFAGCRR